jgi:hypothetical protein
MVGVDVPPRLEIRWWPANSSNLRQARRPTQLYCLHAPEHYVFQHGIPTENFYADIHCYWTNQREGLYQLKDENLEGTKRVYARSHEENGRTVLDFYFDEIRFADDASGSYWFRVIVRARRGETEDWRNDPLLAETEETFSRLTVVGPSNTRRRA